MNMKTILLFLLLCSCSAPPAATETAGGGGASPAGCGLATGYEGDDRCLLGAALHYGPARYDDPAEIAAYTINPGDDSLVCRVLASHEAIAVAGYEASRRDGTHHFSLFSGAANLPLGTVPCGAAANAVFLLQRPHETITIGGSAPEYEGAALQIPAGSWIAQAHAVNTGDVPLLVEAWASLDEVTNTEIPMASLTLSTGHLSHVAPHTKQTVTGDSPAISLPVTVVEITGHFHAHTTEERASVDGREVYRTDTWEEPAQTWFTSRTTGSLTIPAAALAPSGFTGPVVGAFELDPRTSLHWECDVDNTTDITLTSGSDVMRQEMCVLTGFVLGTREWTIARP